MEHILFISRLGEMILAIHQDDFKHLKERIAEVWCVKIDLRRKEIAPIWELEKHLKFNPWEEITSEEKRAVIGKMVNRVFSDEDIKTKIIGPLEEKRVR